MYIFPTLNIYISNFKCIGTLFSTVGTKLSFGIDGALATRVDSTLETRGKGCSLSFGTSSDAASVRKEKAGNTNKKRKKLRPVKVSTSRKKRYLDEDGEWRAKEHPKKKTSRCRVKKKAKSSKRNEEKRKKQ